MSFVRSVCISVCFVCAVVAPLTFISCGSNDDGSGTAVGIAALPLSGVGSSGAQYRLVDGSFVITGNGTSLVVLTNDYLGMTSADIGLQSGDYSVQLYDGWTLERMENGAYEPVEATLTSASTVTFSIQPDIVTPVVFTFNADDDTIPMGDGTLSISIDVDDEPVDCEGSGHWLDSNTGLCWQNTGLTSDSMTRAAAASYCAAGTFGGLTGWRLPTINELVSSIRGCQNYQPAPPTALMTCEVTCDGSDVCDEMNGDCGGCQFAMGQGPDANDGGCYRDPDLSGEIGFHWTSSQTEDGDGFIVGYDTAYAVRGVIETAEYNVRCVR